MNKSEKSRRGAQFTMVGNTRMVRKDNGVWVNFKEHSKELMRQRRQENDEEKRHSEYVDSVECPED